MEKERESYLIDRVNFNPIFVGIWCKYKEIFNNNIIKNGLRWLIIQVRKRKNELELE